MLKDGPLADRDSSGLSRAELWQEFPLSSMVFQLVNVRPLPNGVKVAASISGLNNGDPVISAPVNTNDKSQQWFQQTINGLTTYTSVIPQTGCKRITDRLGDPTAPFRLLLPGTAGQSFKVKVVGCP